VTSNITEDTPPKRSSTKFGYSPPGGYLSRSFPLLAASFLLTNGKTL
jgi:hypothetical protein